MGGGDAETFKEITRAYEVLSNAEKRELFDQYAEQGLEQGDGSSSVGTDPVNLFGSLFGSLFGDGFSQQGGKRQRQRTKDTVHKLNVTLEQIYNGQVRKMAVTRRVVDHDHGV